MLRRFFCIAALLVPLLFASKDSVAGACVCEVPCHAGCCKWCEIWSPDMITALSMAATSVIGTITTTTTSLVVWFEIRIVPTWAAWLWQSRCREAAPDSGAQGDEGG